MVEEVLPKAIQVIQYEHPLSCDHAEDGRYVYPKRESSLCALYILLYNAVRICRDINDSGETYNSPNADAAQALTNLFALIDE